MVRSFEEVTDPTNTDFRCFSVSPVPKIDIYLQNVNKNVRFGDIKLLIFSEKPTKNPTKTDKLSVSEKNFVGPCRGLKNRQKPDKTDKKPTDHFVGAHPSPLIRKCYLGIPKKLRF